VDKFFTADHHFNHKGIIEHCNRPFKNVLAMNEYLINCWNEVVPRGGLVYHLGDFAWGTGKGYGTLGVGEIIDRLNGQIILVRGSHDKPAIKLAHGFVKISLLEEVSINGQLIVLCHYAMRVWRASHFNSWHLYGHSHGRLEPIGKSLDVGVDGHNFYPWSFDEIKQYMEKRPDNFNYVRKKSMSGVNGMLGQVGEVKEWSETNGKIFIHGELWNAISEVPLYPGDKAIIQAVDGLILKVKPIGNSGQD
jgi:calcineurin-like phosphoesterase family protein